MLTLPIKLILAVGTATAIIGPASALADPCGSGGGGINCGIGGGGGTGGGGGAPDAPGDGGGGVGGVTDIPLVPGDGGGGAGGGGGGGGGAAPLPVSSIDLAWRARASAVLPKVVVHTSPKDRTFVRLLTRLWVDGFETVTTEPVSGGGMTVQAIAKPESVDWDLGETRIQCKGGGAPESTNCSYTYQRSSAQAEGGIYQVKAKITWSVSWTCTGPCVPAGGDLPGLSSESAPEALTVDEIQTGSRPG